MLKIDLAKHNPIRNGICACIFIAIYGLMLVMSACSSPETQNTVTSKTSIPTSTTNATFIGAITPEPTDTSTSIRAPITVPSPTYTAIPSPTYTAIPSPTYTAIPSPTYTAIPTSIPTPVPVPNEHYAVVIHTTDPKKQKWFLDALGTKWFLDWTSEVTTIPDGYEKLIPIINLPGPSTQEIQEIAALAPGSVWYIVGEPNRRHGYSANEVVTELHDLYEEIKAADPTARITSPSILNWEFTCNGCLGFQNGRSWVDEFRNVYMAQYNGEEPPVDIWAIDVYPLDWLNKPTVDHQLAIDQIEGLRQYLDSIPEQKGKPIWITELGLHWGWDDWDWEVSGCEFNGNQIPSPAGTYQTEQVIRYLETIFDWLDANAISKNIEKWFVLSTYANIRTCNVSAYAGLTLFDDPDIEANLTPVGQYFRDRILGIYK